MPYNTIKNLLIATHNQGKFIEIEALFKPFGVRLFSAAELDIELPEEDGKTFVENAFIKAKVGAKSADMPCLADDSGLEINALGGRPGIHSARLAGKNRDFIAAMKKIQNLMQDKKDTKARFISALAFCWPHKQKIAEIEIFNRKNHSQQQYMKPPISLAFIGKINGNIAFPPKGNNGFGYDPIFIPKGFNVSFAQMPSSQKHHMSHRSRAFDLFKEKFLDKK